MIRRQRMDAGTRVKVTFSLPARDGAGVAVAGDFNDWDPTAAPLQRRGNGRRSRAVVLEPGRRYAFRYVDDSGRWFNDEAADDFESNGLGDLNGIVDLRERP